MGLFDWIGKSASAVTNAAKGQPSASGIGIPAQPLTPEQLRDMLNGNPGLFDPRNNGPIVNPNPNPIDVGGGIPHSGPFNPGSPGIGGGGPGGHGEPGQSGGAPLGGVPQTPPIGSTGSSTNANTTAPSATAASVPLGGINQGDVENALRPLMQSIGTAQQSAMNVYGEGMGFFGDQMKQSEGLAGLAPQLQAGAQRGLTDYYGKVNNPFGGLADRFAGIKDQMTQQDRYSGMTNPFSSNLNSNYQGLTNAASDLNVTGTDRYGSLTNGASGVNTTPTDRYGSLTNGASGLDVTADDRFSGLTDAASGLDVTAANSYSGLTNAASGLNVTGTDRYSGMTDRSQGMTDRTQGQNLQSQDRYSGLTDAASGLDLDAQDRFGGVTDPWAGRADELRDVYEQNQQQYQAPGSFDVDNPFKDRANPWADGNQGLQALIAGNRANIQRQFDLAQQQTQRDIARRGLAGSGLQGQAMLNNSLERAKALGAQANADTIANYERRADWDTDNLGRSVDVDAGNADRRLKALNDSTSSAQGLQGLINQALSGQSGFLMDRARGQASVDDANMNRALAQAQASNQFGLNKAQGQASIDDANMDRQLDQMKAGNQFQVDQAKLGNEFQLNQAKGQSELDQSNIKNSLTQAQLANQFGLDKAEGEADINLKNIQSQIQQAQLGNEFNLDQARGQADTDQANIKNQLTQAQIGNQFGLDKAQGQQSADIAAIKAELEKAQLGNQFSLGKAAGQAEQDNNTIRHQLTQAELANRFSMDQAGGLDRFLMDRLKNQGDYDLTLNKYRSEVDANNANRMLDYTNQYANSETQRATQQGNFLLDQAKGQLDTENQSIQNLYNAVNLANTMRQTGLSGLNSATGALGQYNNTLDTWARLFNSQADRDAEAEKGQQAIFASIASGLAKIGVPLALNAAGVPVPPIFGYRTQGVGEGAGQPQFDTSGGIFTQNGLLPDQRQAPPQSAQPSPTPRPTTPPTGIAAPPPMMGGPAKPPTSAPSDNIKGMPGFAGTPTGIVAPPPVMGGPAKPPTYPSSSGNIKGSFAAPASKPTAQAASPGLSGLAQQARPAVQSAMAPRPNDPRRMGVGPTATRR